MSPQESQVLESFLNQLVQARAGIKDPQAEALIAEAVAKQPDAAYLLVQRAMLQDQALAASKAQIVQLQNQLQAAQAGQGAPGNFLDPASAWGNSVNAAPVRSSQPAVAPAASTPYAAQAQPAAVQPSRPGFFSGGFGSTLGNIATTAAGVAGGAFLFQGIENLLHHNSGNGFFGQPLGAIPREETIINNYYSNDEPARDDSFDTVLDDNYTDDPLQDDDSSLI
jgi:hypothetical protein